MIIEYLGVEFDVEYSVSDEAGDFDHPAYRTINIESVFLNGFDAKIYAHDELINHFKQSIWNFLMNS